MVLRGCMWCCVVLCSCVWCWVVVHGCALFDAVLCEMVVVVVEMGSERRWHKAEALEGTSALSG